MGCKQRTIDKLLQTLGVCLQRGSLIRDENIFTYRTLKLIQIHKTLINQNILLPKNIKESVLNVPLDNSRNSNEYNVNP